MGKRFKSATCAYGGDPGATADHVFARSFLPETHRGAIPQVAACAPCNNAKSALEHYRATVLPFSGNHLLSKPMLEHAVPRRLDKNKKLHRALAAGQKSVAWIDGETTQASFGIPWDHDQLLAYAYRKRDLMSALSWPSKWFEWPIMGR